VDVHDGAVVGAVFGDEPADGDAVVGGLYDFDVEFEAGGRLQFLRVHEEDGFVVLLSDEVL
jgi:hypothetical protein